MKFRLGRMYADSWPWERNRYDGNRHILSWFMFRIAQLFPGREIRLGRQSWRFDKDDS